VRCDATTSACWLSVSVPTSPWSQRRPTFTSPIDPELPSCRPPGSRPHSAVCVPRSGAQLGYRGSLIHVVHMLPSSCTDFGGRASWRKVSVVVDSFVLW
jgi:hypothetical protein